MSMVYRHRRLDNNNIFYIGIGKDKYRVTSKTCRNKYWKNITAKTEYSVEILYDNITFEEAIDLEILLISLCGRKDLDLGLLVNMTDGGKGFLGNKHSKKTKLKMKNSAKGFSKKARQIRLDSIRKKVIDIQTGRIFISVKEAAEESEYSQSTTSRYLLGKTKNKTNLKYLIS